MSDFDEDGQDTDIEEDGDDQYDEDVDQEEEEEEYDSDEERPDDIPELYSGLTSKYRTMVKEARQAYFAKKASENKPNIQKSIVKDIENEWKGVLSLPELPNATFDFQVLRNLLDKDDSFHSHDKSEDQDNILSLRRRRLDQLSAQQKGDTWRYDLGEEEEYDDNDEESQ